MRGEEPKIGQYGPEGGTDVVRDERETARQNEETWDSRAKTYDAFLGLHRGD